MAIYISLTTYCFVFIVCALETKIYSAIQQAVEAINSF